MLNEFKIKDWEEQKNWRGGGEGRRGGGEGGENFLDFF